MAPMEKLPPNHLICTRSPNVDLVWERCLPSDISGLKMQKVVVCALAFLYLVHGHGILVCPLARAGMRGETSGGLGIKFGGTKKHSPLFIPKASLLKQTST